jgi:hypothetical protein
LIGAGGTAGLIRQGETVAISADGNTAVIGGPSDNNNVGAAWVFVRNGGTWVQQGNKLVGTGAIGQSRQAQSLAISGDGNTVILGAPGDNSAFGAVWIFKRVSGVWQQSSKIVITDNILQPAIGRSVAISADGNTLLAGGTTDNGGVGAVWIFKRSGDYWQQQHKLIGTVDGGAQGFSVSVNADGSEAFVGSYNYFPNEPENGYPADFTAIVTDYKLISGNWVQQTKDYRFFTHNFTTNILGAVPSADAKTILAAGPVENATAPQSVLSINSTNQFELVANNTQPVSMAISADGSTAMLGFGYEGTTGLLRAFVSAEKQSQYITFNQPGPFNVGTADVTLVATSTNTTLPINFSSSDTTVATIVSNKLHIKVAGVTTVTAFQDDAVITPVSRMVTINGAGSFAAMQTPSLASNQNEDGLGDSQKAVIPYPNPFVSGVKLNLGNSTVSNASVNVYELSESGKLVYANQYTNTSGVVQLNLDNLKSGYYVLKLTTGKQVKFFKIVKR